MILLWCNLKRCAYETKNTRHFIKGACCSICISLLFKKCSWKWERLGKEECAIYYVSHSRHANWFNISDPPQKTNVYNVASMRLFTCLSQSNATL